MTDLQISLMALGSTIVVAVISYNKWQEYKAKKTVERAFSDEHDDVLMTPESHRSAPVERERTEPRFLPDSSPDLSPESLPESSANLSADAVAESLSLDAVRASGEISVAAALAGVPVERELLSPGTKSPLETSASTHGFIDKIAAHASSKGVVSNPVTDTVGAVGAVHASHAVHATHTNVASNPSDTPIVNSTPRTKDLPVDPIIDFAVPLALGSNLPGEKIIESSQALRHVGNKAVNFIGLREHGQWEAIQHGSLYRALMAGVQLADRSAALNEIEFSELVTRLRQVADELDAEPDVPNMKSVMQSAHALAQFVGQYDAQLSVNLQAKNGAWSIPTLLAALERQGFDVRADGRLAMPDGDGGNLFTLSTNVIAGAESTTRLTLLLDVPCVAPERDGFGAMTACARSLSHRLDGVVVDDSQQPLSDVALAEIADQVKRFYADMQAADIPAGSLRASRLFS